VWHIHAGRPPSETLPVTFALLLNLVSASNAENRAVLWGFIGRYAPGVTPETHPKLDELVGYALRYYEDQVKPTKRFSAPDEVERDALARLDAALGGLGPDASPEDVQTALYDVARAIPRYQDFSAKGATPERPGVSQEWFSALYRTLIGQEKGPRFGSFVALYGVEETRALIARALAGELAKAA
jgi:lysyl-tRNA synthetase class 1